MSRIGSLRDDDRWTCALLGGGASLPFTLLSYWQTGSTLSLSPVFLGGLLAAYLAQRRAGTSDGVGLRAGLVGSAPVLWMLVDVAGAATALFGPTWFVGVAGAFAVGVLVAIGVVGVGLAALAGALGGRVGRWLARRTDPRRPSAAG